MTEFLHPDVYAVEDRDIARPIQGTGTSVTGFSGFAARGPVRLPQRIASYEEFRRVYGEPLQYQALGYAVKGFFENGGIECWVSRFEHYTDPADAGSGVGVAAETDLDGIGSAAYASYTGDAPVSKVTMAPGWHLDIDIDNIGVDVATFLAEAATVDGSGGTFGAGDADATAGIEVGLPDGGWSLVQVIDLDGVSAGISNYLDALNAQVDGMSFADDGGGQLRLTADLKGLYSKFRLSGFGTSFATLTGLSAGTWDESTDTVNNNVNNIEAVTFAEIQAVVEDGIKTAVAGDKLEASQNPQGFLALTATNGLPGPTSEIDLTAASTSELVAALGLSGLGTQGGGSPAVGTATSSTPALKIKAGYRGLESPGLEGNSLSLLVADAPRFESAGLGEDLAADYTAGDATVSLTSSTGIGAGTILKFAEGATTEYGEVQKVDVSVAGSSVEHVVTLVATLTNSFVALNATCESVEHTITVLGGNGETLETWPQLSMNPNVANYAVTRINDSVVGSDRILAEDLSLAFPANVLEQVVTAQSLSGGAAEAAGFVNADYVGNAGAKTGRYAFDDVDSLNLLCAPPTSDNAPGGTPNLQANAVIQHSMLEYAGARKDCFAILDSPEAMAPAVVKNYRNNTLGADSRWGAIYWPWIKVPDPIGVGSNPIANVPPSGHVAGIYARVDEIAPPAGGVARAPAGEGEFGKVKGVTGLEYVASDADHDILNPVNVNVIRQFTAGGLLAPGIVVFGARTLSTDVQWQYVNVRRLMTYAEQSIIRGTKWAVFANNDFRTWGKLIDVISRFLRGLHQDGQLQGRSADEAYFVKIDETTTTAADIEAGRLIGEVGLAPQRPAEFIIFKFSQIQSGSPNVQEA